jgi:hypothetical protein
MTPTRPVDPAYEALRDGILRARADMADLQRWRWSPGRGQWLSLPITDWMLENTQLPDTAQPESMYLAHGDPSLLDMYVPELFAAIRAAYDRYKSRWPDLVWSSHGGGDWQNLVRRTTGVPVPRPWPRPTPECEPRIQEVHQYAATGVITSAQAQKLIDRIVADCVGVDPD